jgi:hypothetical protein
LLLQHLEQLQPLQALLVSQKTEEAPTVGCGTAAACSKCNCSLVGSWLQHSRSMQQMQLVISIGCL